jgi:hypothetical protein
MNLPMLPLLPGDIGAVPAIGLPHGGDPAGWKLHLQRAESTACTPLTPASRSPARPEGESLELESCGVPAAPGAPLLLAPDRVASPAASAEEPPPLRSGSQRDTERPALRLHVQHHAVDGLKVWLGIDGDAAVVAQRAAAAVAGLRRGLHGPGDRIAAVVCNGTTLYPRIGPAAPPAGSASVTSSLTKDSS